MRIAVKNFGVCDFSRFGGYGLALAALALVLVGAYDSYPFRRATEQCDTTHVTRNLSSNQP